MLRALALRAAFLAEQSWHAIKTAGRSIVKAPGWMGQVVLSVLSTPAGYNTTIALISVGVRAVLRGVDIAVRSAGRLAAITTGAVCAGIGSVIPAWRDTLIVSHANTLDRINHAYDNLIDRITHAAEQAQAAAHTGLVQAVATRAAAAASALLVLHAITKGTIALHLAQIVPAATTVLAWATSPWLALMGVGTATTVAMAYALRAFTQVPLEDLELTLEVAPDGSITVTGIPDQLSTTDQQTIAQAAASAAFEGVEKYAPRQRSTRSRTRPEHSRRTDSPRATPA